MASVKKTIILLHGHLGSSDDFKDLTSLLEEKEFEVLSFNFFGHGKNATWPDEFRIDLFARQLDDFIVSKKLDHVAIFGASLGGYVALYHKAHFDSSPTSQIFTYGTKFNWSQQAVSKELPMLDPVNLENKFPHVSDYLKNKHGERWKSLLHSTAHMMQNLERLDGLTKEDLSDVTIPVTLVLGDQDRVVTTEETHLMCNWLKHAQFKTLTHSKHELERSNLRELVEIISESIQ